MTHAVHLSPIQYVHTDGRITVEGMPNVKIHTIAEQGAVQGRNWQQELSYRPITKNGRRWRDRIA